MALQHRYGPRPVALSGRAATLHPLVAQAMAARLPAGTAFTQRGCRGERAAARLALEAAGGHPFTITPDAP